MCFFGEIVEDGESFLIDIPHGHLLNITQVCLSSLDDDPSLALVVETGETNSPIVLCHLNKNMPQCLLNLKF